MIHCVACSLHHLTGVPIEMENKEQLCQCDRVLFLSFFCPVPFNKRGGGGGRRLTFRFLGCCRSSSTCLRCSSRSRRLLYSIWFSSSVWCCRRIRSMRSFCSVLSCRCSSSCMDSSWRISMACSISFWLFFLFSSWRDKWMRGQRGSSRTVDGRAAEGQKE